MRTNEEIYSATPKVHKKNTHPSKATGGVSIEAQQHSSVNRKIHCLIIEHRKRSLNRFFFLHQSVTHLSSRTRKWKVSFQEKYVTIHQGFLNVNPCNPSWSKVQLPFVSSHFDILFSVDMEKHLIPCHPRSHECWSRGLSLPYSLSSSISVLC